MKHKLPQHYLRIIFDYVSWPEFAWQNIDLGGEPQDFYWFRIFIVSWEYEIKQKDRLKIVNGNFTPGNHDFLPFSHS